MAAVFDPQRGAFLTISGGQAMLVSTQETLLGDGSVLITGGGFASYEAMLFFPAVRRGRAASHGTR